MRLFIAIDLPQKLKDQLSELNNSINHLKGIKTVSAENMHMTLQFVGEKDDPKQIIAKLKQIEFVPFNLKTSGIGYFPNEQLIKVAWLGIEPSNELLHMQKQIALEFNDKVKYVPHVTFARIKQFKGNEKQTFLETISEFNIQSKFLVEKFKLYSSSQTQIGHIHRVVETFPAKQ